MFSFTDETKYELKIHSETKYGAFFSAPDREVVLVGIAVKF
jgi:hypothetical protein